MGYEERFLYTHIQENLYKLQSIDGTVNAAQESQDLKPVEKMVFAKLLEPREQVFANLRATQVSSPEIACISERRGDVLSNLR